MPTGTNCCNECPTVQVTNIPGLTGPAGTDGTNGTDGLSSFSYTDGAQTTPADYTNAQTFNVLDTTWMVIGQIVAIAGPSHYRVTAIGTSTTVNLLFLGYPGDVSTGVAIADHALIAPAGLIGPAATVFAGTDPNGVVSSNILGQFAWGTVDSSLWLKETNPTILTGWIKILLWLILPILFMTCDSVNAAAPPLVRNSLTTNTETAALTLVTNIANGGGGGISASTGTNIAAYQVLIATSSVPAMVSSIQGTNVLVQNWPLDQNRSYDYLWAFGCTNWDTTNANGYYYRASSGNYSNVFFGGISSWVGAFTYTNLNGWILTYPGDNNFYLSNNVDVLMWHHSRGSLLAMANVNDWGNRINAQGIYFPYAYNDGTTNVGPTVTSGYTNYNATLLSTYQKIVVLDGDSRMAGWPQSDNWGSTAIGKLLASRPFFKNAFLTNVGISGSNSSAFSNHYASVVYPLRPQNGQVGYYVLWTMANGDTPASVTNVLKPYFKQLKKDGWIICPILNYPVQDYEANNGKTYGQDVYDMNCALRKMTGKDGGNGYWDILIDMESNMHSIHDTERGSTTDMLHLGGGAATSVADLIARRLEQGSTTEGEMNATPAMVWGTYAKYSQTNVVVRTHPQYGNFLFAGAPVISSLGIGGMTNPVASWPTIPQSPGAYDIQNSNGTVYLRTSLPNTQAWDATNKLGP